MGQNRNPMWMWVLFFIVVFLFFPMAYSVDEEVKKALLRFMERLKPANTPRDWNLETDPCIHEWHGVECYSNSKFVRSIVLEDSGFNGILDAASLCTLQLLQVLSLKNNHLQGLIPEDIGTCKSLAHLYLNGNDFSGDLPLSLSHLSNLKRIDLSDNNFSGDLPDMGNISGLLSFHAQNNKFTGEIPNFEFSNLVELNVSNNNLHGPIPDVKGLFGVDSFSGNPNLCGTPLPNSCPPPPSPPPYQNKNTRSFSESLAIYSGYVILGVVVLLFFTFKTVTILNAEEESSGNGKKQVGEEGSEVVRSEYSVTSVEKGMMSATSLVVLASSMVGTLRFEDMLKAPAELVGRGKHGSTYRVMMENGVVLAVKRMKGWGISKMEFERRMQKIEQVKHHSVNPLLAFYCSEQEKLLVYEYLHNGSLFSMLSGSQGGKTLDWKTRLNVAATIAEALAHVHDQLYETGIPHGNVKSTNILFHNNMDPCLTEYGLVLIENQHQSILSRTRSLNIRNPSASQARAHSTFKVDTYAFGVVLLELLTGKVVQSNGFDLAKWVGSVVREEWSGEVFDRSLMGDGVSEERMMNLLQIALKCVSACPGDRPCMSEVAVMTTSLKEEEERSLNSSFDMSDHK